MSGRAVSGLNGCLCGPNALQRSLNVSQRLVVVRFTQAQPASAKTQPLTASSCSHDTDPRISLYHRPTRISADSSDICEKAEHCTIYCRYSGAVVNVGLSKTLMESLHDVQQKIREEAFCNEALKVESVDELLYKEIKPGYEYMSLPSLYSKLSKLRLTGTLCAYLLATCS